MVAMVVEKMPAVKKISVEKMYKKKKKADFGREADQSQSKEEKGGKKGGAPGDGNASSLAKSDKAGKKRKQQEIVKQEMEEREAGARGDENSPPPTESQKAQKKRKKEKGKEANKKKQVELVGKNSAGAAKSGHNRKATKHRGDCDGSAGAAPVEGPDAERSAGIPVGGGPVAAPVGMQIYWNLTSVDGFVREEAAAALVQELTSAQRDFSGEGKSLGQEEQAAEAVILGRAKTEDVGLKNCAPAVQYALRRLVRGVASSREGARQGFSLALASILGTLPCISGAAIVNMVEKHLEVTSSMKGQEARDALLGQLFAYGALVRSSLLGTGSSISSEQQELAKDVTGRLLTVAKKKSFLQEAAVCVLAELGGKLEGSGLEKGMFEAPLFLDIMKEEPDVVSPDTLFLALKLYSKLPKSLRQSCSVIPESGNLVEIFEKDHLSRLIPCLKESTKSHPRVHLVWDPLIQILFSEDPHPKSIKKKKGQRMSESHSNAEARLAAFWSTVVDEPLLMSSHERKHLALQLLVMFLPRLPSPASIHHVLSKNVVQCLLVAGAFKENLLYKTAQSCIAEVCKWAEGNDEQRIGVVMALQRGSEGKFGHLSKIQHVKGLLDGLTTISGYQLAFKALSDIYLSGESGEGDVAETSTPDAEKQRISETSDTGGDDLSTDTDLGQGPRKWALDQMRSLWQRAHLGTFPAKVVTEDLVTKFVCSLGPVRPFTEEEEEAVSILQSTMLQVSSALSKVEEKGEKRDRLQAMLSLLVQLLFESRVVPNIAVGNASELTICCKKAFSDLQLELEDSQGEDEQEEPAFMDVLVDVLLSLLAQPSAHVRAAADQVFKSFCGDLTSSGLTDLLRIVKKNTQRSRHKPIVEVEAQKADDDDILDVEESEDEDDEEGNEDEAESENEDEDGSNDEKDGSSGDEEEGKAGKSNEVARVSSKRKRDGSGAEEERENEDDEEDGSDMDDDAMFRMDKHLVNIFRQRKQQGGASGTGESKDAETQLLHFKFRVLALLEIFLQKHSDSVLVPTMLPSLLHVFANSCTTDGNAQLADRVSSILQNKLFKGKQYPKGPEVDQASLKGLLAKALKLASRSTVKRVSAIAQGACHWLMKVIHGNAGGEKDKDVEKMISAALEDYFCNKKSRFPFFFFREVFNRDAHLGNCLLGNVLEKCTTARSEFLKFEALHLAGIIVKLHNGKLTNKFRRMSPSDLESTGALLRPHLPSMSKVVSTLFKDAPSAKAVRRVEALQFSVSFVELYQLLCPEKKLGEFIAADDLASVVKEISALPKSKAHNFLVKLQQLEEKARA